MISAIQNLHIGNALRLFIEPPAGALRWRILRKGSDTFSGHADPSALVAYEGDLNVIVDSQSLSNETMAFYRPFYTTDGNAWTAGASAHGTPTADYEEFATDVLSIIRDRVEAGLKIECERGNFQPEAGYIQVMTASPALTGNIRLPLVTVHMETEDSGERAIGDNISGDEFDQIGFDWNESEGWLADVRVTLIGWSVNSDERIELRKAIRRVIIGNMPVFQDEGMDQISLTQHDIDAVNGEYGDTNIFQVMSNFSCVSPVRVGGKASAIREVHVIQRSY